MHQPRGPVPPTYDPTRLIAEAEASGPVYRARRRAFISALWLTFAWILLLWLWPRARSVRVRFARWGRQEMVRQGAVFIKFGQMLSTRVDAFPEDVLAELSKLQDQVPAFPFEAVRAIVEEDLGGPLERLFRSFDPTPLAAASLGQVHAATLPSGEDAVVKVLRPGLAARFAVDLVLMRWFAQWLEAHPRFTFWLGGSPDTPYVALVDRLGVSCYQQLDLWVEGLHGEKFARNFERVARIGAPGIYWSHSSTRVLTQERVYGVRFDDEHAIRAAGIDYLEMAGLGIQAFTKQIFEDAFFHADTHPGNIFVTPDARLIYLDFGMVEYIDEKFQRELVEMFIHVIQQDWDAFYDDMVRADIVPPDVPRQELLPIFTDVWAAQLGFTDRRYTLQEVSDKFYALMRRYPFRLPDRFLFLTRTAASMEGVVYRADPSFKFLPIALPFFAKLVLRRVDVENPWILQELMRVAASGGMMERLGSLVQMAIADEPDAMNDMLAALLDVLAHPGASALRREVRERVLTGGFDAITNALPPDVSLERLDTQKLEAFLASPTGRELVVSTLEDPRFPSALGRLVPHPARLPKLKLDWVRLLQAWFPGPSEQARAAAILQRVLISPEVPWARWVAANLPPGPRLSRPAGGGPAPLPDWAGWFSALAFPPGLPWVARGVFKGVADRLNDSLRHPWR
ncbi:MAG: AarF/ABC1/UbiB kinase family protein [Candidatus Sericytochromatia bacterium]|nr:AarF/ABC1/UbiB kinase family protein [Candidatus Sericytochromatia bacterium]